MKVLVVEDESRLANFIRKGLKEAGYAVDMVDNGEEADYMVSVNDYDAILLDWMLPDMSGVDLCQMWRKAGIDTPIIMVTAKDTKEDIVAGLNCGADDYVAKPFSFAELLARLRAVIRRASTMNRSPVLKLDDLTMDVARRDVRRGNTKVHLSSREFSLLEYLLRNAGRPVTKAEISEHVWGNYFETNSNIIEVTINHLRKKLDCGSRRQLIHTIRGVGYMIKELEEST
ncbi:MAG: DNA-binding response regulator [Calditrichaeota bacterium]|nr:MAG: DNA-binding response regulator [Calditrichota bacterium]